MKNYYHIPVKFFGDDYGWTVYEVTTEQLIGTFYFEEDAFDLASFFNDGGGFDGFTPSFMLRSVTPLVTDMNDEFTQAFV